MNKGNWQLPAKAEQRRAIARMAHWLGIADPIEEGPMTRWQARELQYRLRMQLKARRR